MVSKSFSCDTETALWLEEKAKIRDMNFSEFMGELINGFRDGYMVDGRNPNDLRSKGEELIQKGKDLCFAAMNLEIEQHKNEEIAKAEADRVLAARTELETHIKATTPEGMTEEASQWVAGLSLEKRLEFQSFIRKNNLKIREGYVEALRIGFPEKSLE